MPRDNDKRNDSRGRPNRPGGGKGRSGVPRGPEKKFAKRGFAGKAEGERSYAKKPFSAPGKAYAGKRDDRTPRFARDDRPRDERAEPRRDFRAREDRGGDKRSYTPRGDRPDFDRDDRAPRNRDRNNNTRGRKSDTWDRKSDSGGRKSDTWDRKSDSGDRKSDSGDRKGDVGDRREARAASRFQGKKFGDKRPYAARGEGFRRNDERPRRDRPFSDRPSREPFGDRPDRGDEKPWQKRGPSDRGGERNFDKPRFGKPRYDKSREDRGEAERPRFSREDRLQSNRQGGDRPFRVRPKFDRPQERPTHRTDWQEHPRNEKRSFYRDGDRPRRDNEDDTKIFARRPAFGGRGAYRERTPEEPRPARPPRLKKSGERIAKVLARAGLASRRDAEEWVVQGRVTVNGRLINSPALDVTANDVITVDGKPLPPRERTRLFLYHKPRGLMTTHADPEGRPTVFDNLPEGLPRLISVGRLDFNTEGLLLLTNDGGLARALELPETGWLRRYRVRAHGEVTQAQLDALKQGVEIDGVKYGPVEATLERDSGANVWLVFAIREGKNREVRNVMAHLGLEVNRLIRISYGPFQLAELGEGAVEEVKTRVLREQLGEKIATLAGADFDRPIHHQTAENSAPNEAAATRSKKPFRPAGKSGLIADRKGRRVLVQRSGSEEGRARNEAEASGYGPPRRPKRGYHGKRDLKPRDE